MKYSCGRFIYDYGNRIWAWRFKIVTAKSIAEAKKKAAVKLGGEINMVEPLSYELSYGNTNQ